MSVKVPPTALKPRFKFSSAVATASTSLYAQTMDMQANIPFDFRISSTVLPSGQYSVHHSGNMLFVRKADGSKGGIFMTVGEDHPNISTANGTLLFNRYGNSYYLVKLWTPDADVARAPLKSSRERELASHIGLSEPPAFRTK